MKGRSRVAGHRGGGGAPTDLLFCFPSRAHLALMQKPICSPSRPADLTKRRPIQLTSRCQSSTLFRSSTRNYSGGAALDTTAAGDITDEPTSPKVTCAGQIKVRPRSSSVRRPATSSAKDSKGWFSVMEEMERLHRNSKKPLLHFLCAIRDRLRFDLTCFGSFHGVVDCSTDEEEVGVEEEEEGEKEDVEEDKDSEDYTSKTIFSNWFMVLENQSHELEDEEVERKEAEAAKEEAAPPSNALLLMRCRSAPTKRGGRCEIKQDEEEEVEKEKTKEKMEDRLMVRYSPDFMKLSTEIVQETWVVGRFDTMARSRSWKR